MVYFGQHLSSIPEFENYDVSSDGAVFNVLTGREMILSPTMHGDLTVGLMKDGRQYRRSVKVLVAEAFVNGQTDIFDTPILLDGNKHNLRADNITWRPRWFAWKYARQFAEEFPPWFYMGPVFDIINEIKYVTIIEAAITNGTLCNDIYMSIVNETRVFPTGEMYVKI